MRILVLGASGLLGNTVFRLMSEKPDWVVFGSLRTEGSKKLFPVPLAQRLVVGVDALNRDSLITVFEQTKPNVVINCISLSKPLLKQADPLHIIPIYAVLPHRLAEICSIFGARLVQISTDFVFSGSKGQYTEDDFPDSRDVYGISKLLGEVSYPHTLTIRTSMIGHELSGVNGLLEWFLSQHGSCRGFTRAIFSGLPTVILAQVIRDFVIPNTTLFGVYHVAAEPISKFDLLCQVAETYGKSIEIIPVDQPVFDRSLNSDRFNAATGYRSPSWPTLIRLMHSFR